MSTGPSHIGGKYIYGDIYNQHYIVPYALSIITFTTISNMSHISSVIYTNIGEQ
jgi:hypothetical protein